MRKKQVVVIGSSEDTEHSGAAREIGAHIAARGWILVSGGRGGVMEAASRGAFEAGGIVIGVTPYDSFTGANEFCTAVIPTGIGFARNSINVLAGDVIVAINGRWGTLSEIAYALQYGRPLVCCAFTGGWASQIEQFAQGGEIIIARTVREALDRLDSLLL
jgi:uncharacterized protein (TIGR00725 family)